MQSPSSLQISEEGRGGSVVERLDLRSKGR